MHSYLCKFLRSFAFGGGGGGWRTARLIYVDMYVYMYIANSAQRNDIAKR